MFLTWFRRPADPADPRRRTFRPRLESLQERAVLTAPAVSLTASADPVAFGQVITFTATVDFSNTNPYSFPGSGPVGATVTFFDGATALGTVPLQYVASNLPEQATFTTSQLSPGGHSITARFNADGTWYGSTPLDPSTSQPRTEVVTGGVTPVGTGPRHHHHRPIHPHHPGVHAHFNLPGVKRV